MLQRLLLAVILLASGTAFAASELIATRVDGSARITRADGGRALIPKAPLLDGDTLALSGNSRVSLQLAGRGLISLARGAELQVFDSRGGATAVGRLKLLSGTARIDSRGKPAQDIRLNIGSLKARIYGAEAIGANDAAGDTLCVLAGAVEVQTAGAPDARLDLPGSCLRRTPDGLLRNLRIDTDSSMSSSLAATESVSDSITVAAPAASRPTPIIAPAAPVAAAPAPVAAPAPAATAATGSKVTGWTVVVLSFSLREPMDQRAQSLQDQGLPATTRVAEVKGKTMYRVTVGEFAAQAEARDYAKNTLAKAGIDGWVSPLF